MMPRGHGYTFIAQSQYAGVCAGCGDPYDVGDPIWWRRGGPCYHKDCEPSDGDAAAVAEAPRGRTEATVPAERETGAERTLKAKIAALESALATAQNQAAACVRATAALTRAVMALADGLGAAGTVTEHLDEVERALRGLTDPHADAKAAQAAEPEGADGDVVPF